MLEMLKKIGLPATVSAVIATLVTVAPLLFKIDERYAKDSDVQEQAARTEKAMNEMATEIGKLNGTQAALLAIITAQERRAVAREVETERKPLPLRGLIEQPAPVAAAPAPTPTPRPEEVRPKFDEVSKAIRSQQERLKEFKY